MIASRTLMTGASLALFGCASTHSFQVPLTQASRTELAGLLPRSAEMTWSEGNALSREAALDISIADGVATWMSADKPVRQRVPEAALRSMNWNSHARGAGRGALIGGLTLGLFLAAGGAASGSDPPLPAHPNTDDCGFCPRFTAADKAVIGGLYGFVTGAVAGALIGAIVGSEQHVEFVAAPAR